MTSIMSVILMIICLITVWNHRKIKKKLDYYKTYNTAMKNANIYWHDGNTTGTNMSATSSTWWSTKFVWWFQYCTVDSGTERPNNNNNNMLSPFTCENFVLINYKRKINSFWRISLLSTVRLWGAGTLDLINRLLFRWVHEQVH